MKKSLKVLIGDNSVELGMVFSKNLKNFGCETICRRNEPRLLFDTIASESPDVLIYSVSGTADASAKLISRIKSEYPRIKVIAVSYISSQSLCRRLILSGADRYILMPVTMRELHAAIIECGRDEKTFEFDTSIEEFMIAKGFPVHIKGFHYLCTGIALALMNPAYTSDITGALYSKIAEIHGVKPSLVERALRHLANVISVSGADRLLIGRNERWSVKTLTNYELICLSADAFASKYKIFE